MQIKMSSRTSNQNKAEFGNTGELWSCVTPTCAVQQTGSKRRYPRYIYYILHANISRRTTDNQARRCPLSLNTVKPGKTDSETRIAGSARTVSLTVSCAWLLTCKTAGCGRGGGYAERAPSSTGYGNRAGIVEEEGLNESNHFHSGLEVDLPGLLPGKCD